MVKYFDASHNNYAYLDGTEDKMDPLTPILPLFLRLTILNVITANRVVIKEIFEEFLKIAKLEEECIKFVVKKEEIIISLQVLRDVLENGDESTHS